ncbi:DNA repair protein [Aliivibrio kagoshimensis]|uniref:DNA repair protein n=1 Tax=Aliivibrio kagoshimensis TaxID=2910230 RepID=UPI003D0BC517
MNIALLLGLFGLLFALIIGYNIIVQYRTRIESAAKHEIAKYNAIIETTEELIGHAHQFPFSKELLLSLNQRILDALKAISDLAPTNKSYEQRMINMQSQFDQLQNNYAGGDSTSFKSPTNDQQAINMLKLVKRLREILRAEHKKGRVNTQVFVTENARLETFQIRINIENVIKRSKDAIARGQSGTAKQLLKKGIDALTVKNDSYSNKARAHLESMLDELNNKSKKERDDAIIEEEKEDDIDALFQPKKKW